MRAGSQPLKHAPCYASNVKSYYLEGISSCEKAEAELERLLPGQQSPWLLKAADGDPIAYFNVANEITSVDPDIRGSFVTVNISGRHYNEDAAVIFILRQLQSALGGDVRNDDGELV
jgi:hypothetical protein